MSGSELKKSPMIPEMEVLDSSKPMPGHHFEDPVSRLRLLWDRRKFLFRMALAGAAISLVIAFVFSNRYESKTELMPPSQNSSGVSAMLASAVDGSGLGSLASGGLGGQLLGLSTSGDLFVGILQSRTVQDDLIQKFDLKKVYGVRGLDDARKNLGNNVDIGQDRKSGIITISVTDKSPARAAAMAQEYVEQLNRVVTDSNTSSAHRERVFLEDRLAQVQKDLETSENNFSQFASKNTAIDVPEQGKALVEGAATVQGELIASQSELEGLKQIYADNNVRVRSLSARVAELQSELNKLIGSGPDVPGAASEGAGSAYPSIRKLPLLGVTYGDLYRQTKVQESIYETLTREYELARVEEAKEIPAVKELDPPNVPEKKVFPPRFLILLSGVAIFLIGGIAWIFAQALWQDVDQRDPRKMLAQEVWSSARASVLTISEHGSGVRDISSKL